MTVIWMRHGTSHDALHHPGAHAHPDTPLSTIGADETAKTMHNLLSNEWRPRVVISSPQPRALATATIAAHLAGLAGPEPLKILREWGAPPCVHGKRPDQYPPEYLAWRRARSEYPGSALPGGESLTALTRRARRARQSLTRLAEIFGPILAVSHQVFIGAVAARTSGISDPAAVFEYARHWRMPCAGTWHEQGN